MKKRLFMFLTIMVAVVLLASCGKKTEPTPTDSTEPTVVRTYAADGVFTAFEVGENYGNPQVTWVTVTIKNDAIEKFEIDELQSTLTEGVFAWNEKTKKELGDDYGMIIASEIEKEWYEQAAAIEAKWLADGVDSVTSDESGYIDNMAGEATMIDAYSHLAAEALENAVKGIAVAFEVSLNYGAPQITWVEVTVVDGAATKFYIDELQTTLVDGKYVWNEKTKKELGDDYGMIIASEIEKEWYEQAAAIEAKWLADGVDSVTSDESGYIDNMAGEATMIDAYSHLAQEALDAVTK